MFCNKCGAELPEGSSFCLKCGAPVVHETEGTAEIPVITEPTQKNDKAKGLKYKLPEIILVALIVFTVILIIVSIVRTSQGSDINAGSVAITELYNPSLGVGLRLGMSKSVVDQKLGEPQLINGEYFYNDTQLYVKYSDGKLSSMNITWSNDQWITKSGVSVETTVDELRQLLGEPDSIEHDDKWWYYVSGNIVTGFRVSSNSIMSIYIYDETLIGE